MRFGPQNLDYETYWKIGYLAWKAAVKNRMHLDIEVSDLEQALKRVETLGGRLVNRVPNPGVGPFVICADPDGNEFCLVSP